MIELRDCIVGVKDVKEYEKVIQIAKEQVGGVRRLIMVRKEMANDKFKRVYCFGE